MKKIKKIVLVIEEVLSNKPFAYFVLILAIAGLCPPMISWEINSNLSQLMWPSLVKLLLALPFMIFHLVQMVVYKKKSAYPGIEPPDSIFNNWNLGLSYLMYSMGVGIIFCILSLFKFINLYINNDENERKPIPTWWIWDIIAVIAISIIAYKIHNPITMEDILGY